MREEILLIEIFNTEYWEQIGFSVQAARSFFLVLFCGSLHFLAIRIIAIFRVVVSQIVTPCPCNSEHGETVALNTENVIT